MKSKLLNKLLLTSAFISTSIIPCIYLSSCSQNVNMEFVDLSEFSNPIYVNNGQNDYSKGGIYFSYIPMHGQSKVLTAEISVNFNYDLTDNRDFKNDPTYFDVIISDYDKKFIHAVVGGLDYPDKNEIELMNGLSNGSGVGEDWFISEWNNWFNGETEKIVELEICFYPEGKSINNKYYSQIGELTFIDNIK